MVASATLSPQVFTQGNTQAITLEGLQDVVSGAYLNAAALSATLYDPNGNAVAECTDVNMPYVPGSNGNYQGIFGDNNFMPPVGTGYRLVVTGTQNGGYIKIVSVAEVQERSY